LNVILTSLSELESLQSKLRLKAHKVVFTNGVFDILHAGHVMYLEAARAMGDVLVVGMNTDESVRRIKGPARPVNAEQDRAFVLAALRCVDHVVLFDEDTPLNLITLIMPDVLVKGGDYTRETIIGADEVEANGGIVATIPLLDGRSTTNIIAKARS
jgi:D-beta-D-heptose 7-phosphate kinase/D-beta-D-heptose 1-phosphate adenosyltransferase